MLDVESAKTCEAQDDRCWMLSLLRHVKHRMIGAGC